VTYQEFKSLSRTAFLTKAVKILVSTG